MMADETRGGGILRRCMQKNETLGQHDDTKGSMCHAQHVVHAKMCQCDNLITCQVRNIVNT